MKKRTAILLLIFIGFLVYFPSLSNNFILGDDTDQIVENTQIQDLHTIPSFFTGSTYYRPENNQLYGLYYKPFMMIAYTVIYQFAGLDPLPYHLFQLILHITNGILIFFLFQKFFSKEISWFLSLLFIIHPANSEIVLWASTLQDVLYTFFGLVTLLLLSSEENLEKTRRILLIGILLLSSLFSKETGVIFLALSCIYVAFFHFTYLKKIIVITSLIFLIYTFFRFGIAHIGFGNEAISQISRASFATRMLNMPFLVIKYVLLFIFPYRLETHQNWLITKFSFQHVIVPFISIGFISFVAFKLGTYIRKKKQNLWKPYLFFSFWTVLGLLPHLHIIPLDEIFSERWIVISLIGFLGILGIVATAFEKKLHFKRLTFLLLGIVLLFASQSFIRGLNWKDSETLFSHDLKTAQGNYYLENLYASVLINQERFIEAQPYVERSLSGYRFLSNLNNMGIILMKQKNYDEANKYFIESIEQDYNYPSIQNYVNFLVFIKKDNEKAKSIAEKYLSEYPHAGYLWMALAIAESNLGNHEKALTSALKATQLTSAPIVQKVYDDIMQNKSPDVTQFLK